MHSSDFFIIHYSLIPNPCLLPTAIIVHKFFCKFLAFYQHFDYNRVNDLPIITHEGREMNFAISDWR